ncbi:hypothetical protein FB45DRAFT_1011636 [Roridomyces roridus]|uniref:Uncharacterized protein n=1 Tax=Roridomyces roridus TaxID=1738132 RepID=A0AAD7B1P4_9AGAR|nr:hypothetical protein FB45DRAFT_1011636 [Roridomyces roridus]
MTCLFLPPPPRLALVSASLAFLPVPNVGGSRSTSMDQVDPAPVLLPPRSNLESSTCMTGGEDGVVEDGFRETATLSPTILRVSKVAQRASYTAPPKHSRAPQELSTVFACILIDGGKTEDWTHDEHSIAPRRRLRSRRALYRPLRFCGLSRRCVVRSILVEA